MVVVDGSWFWFAEAVLLTSLVLITIFRRRLSSNDAYRRNPSGNTNLSLLLRRIYQRAEGGGDKSPVKATPNRSISDLADRISPSSSDILLHIINFLPRQDIGQLASTNRGLHREILSDAVWRQLWMQRYRSFWNDHRIREIRRIRGIEWDPTDIESFVPKKSWLCFYLEFEFSCLDWLIAGCNTDTCCLLGLQDTILDITEFLPSHPVTTLLPALLLSLSPNSPPHCLLFFIRALCTGSPLICLWPACLMHCPFVPVLLVAGLDSPDLPSFFQHGSL